EPITYGWLARLVLKCGTHSGTHFLDFFRSLALSLASRVKLIGNLLPAIAFVAGRGVATVNFGAHLDIGVPKLPRDELAGCSGADSAKRVEVSRIVHSMVR